MCYNKHTLQFIIIAIQELFFLFSYKKQNKKNNSVP